jgi:hypothetical protein
MRAASPTVCPCAVHAQVISDLPDHDLAGVEAHAHGKGEAALALHLVRVAPQAVAQMQRRPARPLGVVLVGNRRTKQRHDPIARVLVDGALETVDAVRQDLEEAIQDPVPLLGVHLLGELDGALHVGEEHRHLLALALEGGLRTEDLVGQVVGGVVAGGALVFRDFGRSRRHPAGPGECASVPHSDPLDLVLDGFEEAHGPRSSMPKVRFYALGTLPVSPIHWAARVCRSRRSSRPEAVSADRPAMRRWMGKPASDPDSPTGLAAAALV